MNVNIWTETAQFLFLGIQKWDFRCNAQAKKKQGHSLLAYN
jgi:hypothetical protein